MAQTAMSEICNSIDSESGSFELSSEGKKAFVDVDLVDHDIRNIPIFQGNPNGKLNIVSFVHHH